MFIRISKLILLFSLVLTFVLPNFQGLAQEENLEKLCQWEEVERQEKILSKIDFRKLLEKCQKHYEELSAKIGVEITKTERERRTIANQISIFRNRINKLDAQIRQGNVIIKDLGIQLKDTENSIENSSLKIEDSQEKLAAILRAIYKEDKKSLVEIFLAEDTLSGFFDNLMALEILNLRNQELLDNIKDLRIYLEGQKQDLTKEREDLQRITAIQILQKEEGARAKREQERFLRMAEAERQKYLEEKKEAEEKIAKIGTKLWRLVGVRKVPKYEEAVEIAKFVERQTGVRAAFLLGILTQESRIGQNVGQCLLKDFKTGMGVNMARGEIIWPRVMRADLDIPIFLRIIENLNQLKDLNLRPNQELVSCWIPVCVRGNSFDYRASVDARGNIICSKRGYVPFGFGGAMGPAQFIPRTWNLYKDRVAKLTGEIPDPWDFRHAILAAGLKLSEGGALSDGRGERRAAVRYLGADYLGYVNSVFWFADCHQSYIDTGSMSLRCREIIGLE